MSKQLFYSVFGALSIAIFIHVLSFSACTKEAEGLRAYYYPLEGKKQIYSYASLRNDSMPPYYIEISKTADNILITKRIDATNGNIEQIVREEIVVNGMLCVDYKMMQYDNEANKIYTTSADINPNANTFFAFDTKPNDAILPFEISWTNPMDSLEKNTVTRNRLFTGFVKHTQNGKTYDCAEMVVKTRIQSEHSEDGTIAPEYITTEYYAKNIGLIYTKTNFNGKIVEYALQEHK
jgi:hypothetical protein